MKLLLGNVHRDFHLIGGHIGEELTVLLVAGDLLLGAVITNLDKVELSDLIAVLSFHVGSDLGAVRSIVAVQGDLCTFYIDDLDIMVGDIAAADIADAVLIAVLAPVLVHELLITVGMILLTGQALSPMGGAVRVPVAQLVLMRGVDQNGVVTAGLVKLDVGLGVQVLIGASL